MDWKDALSSLRDSGTLPEGASEPSREETPEEEKIQKTPLRIYIDRRHRHGKEATVIEGFLCDSARVRETARLLKQALGCGGSCRDDEILLQGDVRRACADRLHDMGFKTKMC